MPRVTPSLPRNQPDACVLQIVATLRTIALWGATGIATLSLAASVFPSLGHALPAGWTQSIATTLCALLCIFSLTLSLPRRSRRSLLLSRGLAAAVILIAATQAIRYLASSSPAIRQNHAVPQAAFSYLLLGALLVALRTRRPVFSKAVDALTAAVCTVTMIFFYSYILGAVHFIQVLNVSRFTRIAPPAILCLTLLTFVAFNRRAEYGIFSVLFNTGIAGKTARLAAPFALLMPLLRTVGRSYIHAEYVTALCSFAAFFLILIVCRRITALESEVRDLSLRDELTGLCNRRGFYLLAEQAHRLARRSGLPFSVVFLDLDNLKSINDLQGHEAGSTLLREMAALLGTNFRETDILGRIGGDEFVVAGQGTEQEIRRAVQRLEASAARIKISQSDNQSLSFSLGYITADDLTPLALEDMIQRADQIMYETKRLKKNPSSQTFRSETTDRADNLSNLALAPSSSHLVPGTSSIAGPRTQALAPSPSP